MSITVLPDNGLITGMKLGSAETTATLNSQDQQSGFRHQRRADEVTQILGAIKTLNQQYLTAVNAGQPDAARKIEDQLRSLWGGLPGYTDKGGRFVMGFPGEQFWNWQPQDMGGKPQLQERQGIADLPIGSALTDLTSQTAQTQTAPTQQNAFQPQPVQAATNIPPLLNRNPQPAPAPAPLSLNAMLQNTGGNQPPVMATPPPAQATGTSATGKTKRSFTGTPDAFIRFIDPDAITDPALRQKAITYKQNKKTSFGANLDGEIKAQNSFQDIWLNSNLTRAHDMLMDLYGVADKKTGKKRLNSEGQNLYEDIRRNLTKNIPRVSAAGWFNEVAGQDEIDLARDVMNDLQNNPNSQYDAALKYIAPSDASSYLATYLNSMKGWRAGTASLVDSVVAEAQGHINSSSGYNPETGAYFRNKYEAMQPFYTAIPELQTPELQLEKPEYQEMKMGAQNTPPPPPNAGNHSSGRTNYKQPQKMWYSGNSVVSDPFTNSDTNIANLTDLWQRQLDVSNVAADVFVNNSEPGSTIKFKSLAGGSDYEMVADQMDKGKFIENMTKVHKEYTALKLNGEFINPITLGLSGRAADVVNRFNSHSNVYGYIPVYDENSGKVMFGIQDPRNPMRDKPLFVSAGIFVHPKIDANGRVDKGFVDAFQTLNGYMGAMIYTASNTKQKIDNNLNPQIPRTAVEAAQQNALAATGGAVFDEDASINKIKEAFKTITTDSQGNQSINVYGNTYKIPAGAKINEALITNHVIQNQQNATDPRRQGILLYDQGQWIQQTP